MTANIVITLLSPSVISNCITIQGNESDMKGSKLSLVMKQGTKTQTLIDC